MCNYRLPCASLPSKHCMHMNTFNFTTTLKPLINACVFQRQKQAEGLEPEAEPGLKSWVRVKSPGLPSMAAHMAALMAAHTCNPSTGGLL